MAVDVVSELDHRAGLPMLNYTPFIFYLFVLFRNSACCRNTDMERPERGPATDIAESTTNQIMINMRENE
jgi:hypothetical protein